MKITLACPAAPRSRKGNRVTALRWARILKSLGHRVTIAQHYQGRPCGLLVALHARKSFPAIELFRSRYPHLPLILALTGTDLYRDIKSSKQARLSLQWADRLIILQERGRDKLPQAYHVKTRVIHQSVTTNHRVVMRKAPARKTLEVCVLGHLREEKDPLRTALALRYVPATLGIRVTHVGQAMTGAFARQARQLMKRESRYRWLGEVPRWRAQRILAHSDVLVLSSRMEGGANVVSEAIASGVPVLASRIPGSVGLLGNDYPGFFPVANSRALARLLVQVATDDTFYQKLRNWCVELKPLVDPAREKAAWRDLLRELFPKD